MVEADKKLNRLWITWEDQRRSVELARRFGCELFLFNYSGITRYPKCIWKTLEILYKKKPRLLFVQNPSMFLATFACLYGMLTSNFVIVDRHTTFLLTKKYRNTPSIILFKILHRLTLKYADLTIVTNEFLANIVQSLGGRSFILPDKLPCLIPTEKISLKGEKKIFLISSFGIDEPIEEVIAAMALVSPREFFLYISGNYNKLSQSIRDSAPSNVIFTGFLSNQEFINMLFSVDVVMTLTTAKYCMLCGCYEAVAACKPLITSKKKELQDYFTGSVFVGNTSGEISNGILQVFSNVQQYKHRISLLKERLDVSWAEEYAELEEVLTNIVNRS